MFVCPFVNQLSQLIDRDNLIKEDGSKELLDLYKCVFIYVFVPELIENKHRTSKKREKVSMIFFFDRRNFLFVIVVCFSFFVVGRNWDDGRR